MKNILLFAALVATPFFQAQTNAEIKGELEKIQTELASLKTEIQSVKSQNIYLKKVLDVNIPILKIEKDNTAYSITKVVGNKQERTIVIEFLMESENERKSAMIENMVIVDIEGNQYGVNHWKSSSTQPDLSVGVPVRLYFTFDKIIGEPKILKLFRFQNSNYPEKSSSKTQAQMEFRDLNVTWQ